MARVITRKILLDIQWLAKVFEIPIKIRIYVDFATLVARLQEFVRGWSEREFGRNDTFLLDGWNFKARRPREERAWQLSSGKTGTRYKLQVYFRLLLRK